MTEKVVSLHPDAVLFAAILDQSEVLRMENPGFTVSEIYSGNKEWESKSVSVLPDPTKRATIHNKETERIVIFDEKLQINQLRIVYYDAHAKS